MQGFSKVQVNDYSVSSTNVILIFMAFHSFRVLLSWMIHNMVLIDIGMLIDFSVPLIRYIEYASFSCILIKLGVSLYPINIATDQQW